MLANTTNPLLYFAAKIKKIFIRGVFPDRKPLCFRIV